MFVGNPRLISSVVFHRYDQSQFIAVEPETASWAVLDVEGRDFLQSLDGTLSLAAVADGDGEKRELVHRAFAVGLVSMGDQRRLPAGLFQKLPVKIRPWHAVLNVTRNCNLDCVYCYARAGEDTQNMSPDMIYRVFQSYAEYPGGPAATSDGRITMIMHGGEPLLAIDEMREGIRLIRQHPQQGRLELLMQTNGTLFTDKAIEFLREQGMGVGVSIDGTRECQDRTRRFRDGQSSYDAVIAGIGRLAREGIGCGVLVVATSANVDRIGEIFDELVASGIRGMSVNRFFPGGRGKTSRGDLGITNEQWLEAQMTLLHRLIEFNRRQSSPGSYVRIRELGQILQNLLGKSRQWICKRSPCGAGWVHLAFMPDGTVYPCDRYIGEREMVLGNLLETPLHEMLEGNPLLARLTARRVDRIAGCRKCDWRWVCGGDCPARVYLQCGTVDHGGIQCDATRRLIQEMIVLVDRGVLKPEYLISDSP